MVRIFKVEYFYKERYNGKDATVLKETKSVNAKDASHAIAIVGKKYMQAGSYTDDETKKKVIVTKHDFEPINVTLEAEAE